MQSVDASVEGLGRVDSIAGDLGTDGVTGKLGQRRRRAAHRGVTPSTSGDDPTEEPVIVLSAPGTSGSLYLRGERRLDARGARRRVAARWSPVSPRTPASRFVAGVDDDGPALGDRGRRPAQPGDRGGRRRRPAGTLRRPRTRAPAARGARWTRHPTSTSTARVDPVTNDVAAFEGLVGSHGGLGGWQDHGFLLGPADLMAGAARADRGRRRAAPGAGGDARGLRSAAYAARLSPAYAPDGRSGPPGRAARRRRGSG